MLRFDSKLVHVVLAIAAVAVVTEARAQASGQWAGPYAWPFAASHAVLLANGKVLSANIA